MPRPVNETIMLRMLTRRAYHRQGGLCYHCGKPIPLMQVTGDHYPKPRYQGGLTLPGNIVASCYPCNNQRNRETERCGGRLNTTIGDTTHRSPFEILKRKIP